MLDQFNQASDVQACTLVSDGTISSGRVIGAGEACG